MTVDHTRFDLTGKVAVVTGGSRGLGRAMALGFAAAGADVAIVSRKMESCEATAAEVEALGRRALPYACHVGQWDALEPMVDAVWNHFGRIDVLVNNAGLSPLYPSLDQVTEELFDKVFAVNIKAPFRLAALVGARMAEGEGGSIINVSSTASLHSEPHTAPYGAAKAGLNHMTGTFAHAFGPKVRVNCIIPGPFRTDIAAGWSDSEEFKQRAQRYALKRIGEPEEIVGAALYFADDRMSSFTTGALLRVCGGRTG